MPFDPDTFPDQMKHPSGETLVIDRARLVVSNLEAVKALSLGRSASKEQAEMAKSLLSQPAEELLKKADSVVRSVGLLLEDAAETQSESRINNTVWQLWVRSATGEAINWQQVNELEDGLRETLGWPSLLVAPVYRCPKTTATTSLVSPLPYVLVIKLNPAWPDQNGDFAERVSHQYRLQEADISRFLARGYRCFILRDPEERTVFQLSSTILEREKERIEEIFFEFLPLFVPTTRFVPNDQYYSKNQWNLHRIEAEAGWNSGPNPPALGAGIIVAVIDEGGDLNHPDLLGAFANQGVTIAYTGFQTNGGAALLSNSHGTQCAGIVAARCDNNKEGIAGLAGQCQILSIRIEGWNDAAVSAAIGYAVINQARVISMSFGDPVGYSSTELMNKIAEAFAQNVVLCAATTNNRTNLIPYPAAYYPQVIACGASNQEDRRVDFSNYGENRPSGGFLSVVAPGCEIPTTANQGQGDPRNINYTLKWSGTSAATPHVAALAALMIGLDNTLTNARVRYIIETTAAKVPNAGGYQNRPDRPNGSWNEEMGYGRINVLAAVHKVLVLTPPAVPTNLQVT